MYLPKFLFRLTVWALLATGWLHALEVRVASYNVRNYLLADRLIDGVFQRNYPKPEAEKEAIWKVIAEAQPAILAIQEMGDARFLQEFQNDLRAYDLEYPYVYLMQGADPERHTALLSRYPMKKVIPHTDLSFKYRGGRETVKRGLLEAVFETEGVQWSLFVVHLKSRYTNFSDDPDSAERRTKEAEAIRKRILSEHALGSDYGYMIVGDFNDTKDSSTMRRFFQKNKKTWLHRVPALDMRGQSWTYYYSKEERYECVDFLLASKGMLPYVRHNEGNIVDTLPQSVVGSDHRLVYLDLEF